MESVSKEESITSNWVLDVSESVRNIEKLWSFKGGQN